MQLEQLRHLLFDFTSSFPAVTFEPSAPFSTVTSTLAFAVISVFTKVVIEAPSVLASTFTVEVVEPATATSALASTDTALTVPLASMFTFASVPFTSTLSSVAPAATLISASLFATKVPITVPSVTVTFAFLFTFSFTTVPSAFTLILAFSP